MVYDLERRTLLWVGEDRTEQTLRKFFSQLGRRRCRTIQVVLMDMWAPYAKAVRENAPRAQVLFDRFHLVQHLNRAVDEVRRAQLRRLSRKEKVRFKRTRYLLLKNPWNLTSDQKERLSTLVSWNTPITRAYYLKESLQLFFDYKQPKRAREHLERWMHSAMRSRLEPFKRLVKMLRSHLDGVLAWTRLRLSNGAVEGMNNKIKLVSHRAFGFRTVEHYVAAIYHCCARLPLPGGKLITLSGEEPKKRRTGAEVLNCSGGVVARPRGRAGVLIDHVAVGAEGALGEDAPVDAGVRLGDGRVVVGVDEHALPT